MIALVLGILLFIVSLALSIMFIVNKGVSSEKVFQVKKDNEWVFVDEYTARRSAQSQLEVRDGVRRSIKTLPWLTLLIAPLVLGLSIFIGTIRTVDSREVVVVTRFGKVVEVIDEPGIKFTNIFNNYNKFDKAVNTITIEKEVYTSDLQAVLVSFDIDYKIDPTVVQNLFLTYKTLGGLESILTNVALQEAERLASTLTARELTTKKTEYVSGVREALVLQYTNYNIDVNQIRLTNTVYTDQFEALLEQTLLAEQEVIRQKAELEKQLQNAEYQVQIAEQKALEDLAKAQGEANAKEAMAEAEANSIQLVAQANAEAYAAKIQQIALQLGINTETATAEQTDALLSYIKYLEYLAAWDGKLPQIVTDGSGLIINPNN